MSTPTSLPSAEAFVAEARRLELSSDDLAHGARRAARNHESAADAIVANARRAGRDNLLAREQEQHAWHRAQAAELQQHDPHHGIDLRQIIQTQGRDDPEEFRSGQRRDEEPRVLRRDQSVAEWAKRNVQGYRAEHENLDLGRFLRGWLTGSWDGATAEQRVLAEGALSSGGAVVPTPLAARVIDRARNMSRCFQAGAQVVPMSSQTLRVPRLTASADPAWRDENEAISEDDLVFDAVTFTARSLAVIVRCSRELIEDSNPDITGVIENDLARQVAVELDRIMLRGSGVAPEPEGVLNQSGVSVVELGTTDGAAPTYDDLLDQVQAVRGGNFEPTGFIYNPRTATGLAKLREDGATGAYLTPPAALAPFATYSTNQVPVNLTVGASVDASEIYCADWSNAWLGMRTDLQITPLRERYADLGQVGFVLWVRADFQLAQPGAFSVLTGVTP